MSDMAALREIAEHDAELFKRPPQLPTHAWPGGYQLVYFGTDERGDMVYPICPACAQYIEYDPAAKEAEPITLTGAETYDEGPDLICETAWACKPYAGDVIKSSYGDPDATEGVDES